MSRPSDGTPRNVLITAAGRRTSLVKAFMDAAHARDGRVVAGDVDPLAPSLYRADDAVALVRTGDPGYLPLLRQIVEAHRIGLLVPTIDTDLPVLAASADSFATAGCVVAGSSSEFVAITADKYETGRVFGQAGVQVPLSWLPPIDAGAPLPGRVFVKPRRGSASQDTHLVTSHQLPGVIDLVPDPIVQEVLEGPEVTIDALLDLTGRPIHYVPRRRIRTLGGESVQGVTLEHDAVLEAWIEQVLHLASTHGATGPLTLQAFLTERGPVLTEINPRFGGGFPLALAAGADYPAWLLDMVAGRSIEPRLGAYEPGLYMTRSHVEQFTRRPMW